MLISVNKIKLSKSIKFYKKNHQKKLQVVINQKKTLMDCESLYSRSVYNEKNSI